MNKLHRLTLLLISLVAASANGPQLFAQASKLKVNNEKPQKRDQVKRMHPHALKLILQGRKQEAIAYLEGLLAAVTTDAGTTFEILKPFTEVPETHNRFSINYTEPAFVFAIMAMAATRPVLQAATNVIGALARVLPPIIPLLLRPGVQNHPTVPRHLRQTRLPIRASRAGDVVAARLPKKVL